QPIVAALRDAVFDRQILPVEVTGLTQPLLERGHIRGEQRRRLEVSDHRHRLLLRTQPTRRYRCSRQQEHKLAPPHSMTLGTVKKPRAERGALPRIASRQPPSVTSSSRIGGVAAAAL